MEYEQKIKIHSINEIITFFVSLLFHFSFHFTVNYGIGLELLLEKSTYYKNSA